ncbi:type 1 phosphatases regulator ypi1-like isoform X2 [Ischnura elegans]|uniref:type 1 phosphatases regulator ypi1-like isoform X2 n=1 Tax=Ischnura elegans TaxID=197161 RepID=UPI001ED8BDD8|nr:type 1 phosphatases regulator ypi1-like isoform X2 [Ischnura elegans]
MAERNEIPVTSTTLVDNEEQSEAGERLIVRLKLRKPESKKKVQWESGTVDNEHMNKKKSKCCCIYHKPREFDESSSDSEGECENCFGHVEMKKKKVKGDGSDSQSPDPDKDHKPSEDIGNSEDSHPEESIPQSS